MEFRWIKVSYRWFWRKSDDSWTW